MEIRAETSTVSAYHNYRYHGRLIREIRLGNEGSPEAFYFIAREVRYPDPFPSFSLSLFDSRGKRALALKGTDTVHLMEGYRVEKDGDHLRVYDGEGRIFFGYQVIRHENVHVTRLYGVLRDEKGAVVMELDQPEATTP